MDVMGGTFKKGFGLGPLINPDSALAQLIGLSFNHPIVMALIGSVTIALGAKACQGELLSGTLEVTLSKAVSRTHHLLSYVITMAILAIGLMLVAFAAICSLDSLFHVPGHLDRWRALLMCLDAALVFYTFGAIALLVSVLLGRRGNALFVTMGILVVMFALTFAERAWDNSVVKLLGKLSVFHWLDPANILLGGSVSIAQILVPLLISITAILLARWRFEKRDL